MAKTKVKSTSAKNPSFDMMSVTVLLVMAVFGGVVGFNLGRSSTTPRSVFLREAATMMKEKGIMMQDAGKIMTERGKKSNDKEMMEKGQMMLDSGSFLTGKGSGMMGMSQE